MTTTTLLAHEIVSPANSWERISPNEEYFSADAVIDAYFKGIAHGTAKEQKTRLDNLQDEEQAKIQQLLTNLQVIIEGRNKIYHHLVEQGFAPVSSYLQPVSWSTFRTLMIVKEEDYLKDEFLEVYHTVGQLEESIRAKNICHVQFTFTSDAPPLNEEHLRADGFRFKHTYAKA